MSGTVEMKLEMVVMPVSDADRAREFYTNLGWRLGTRRVARRLVLSNERPDRPNDSPASLQQSVLQPRD